MIPPDGETWMPDFAPITAANERDAKPCPFCEAVPVEHLRGFVFCEADLCPMFMRLVPIKTWNRRPEPKP